MKLQRIWHEVVDLVGFLRAFVTRNALFAPPRRLARMPVPVRCRCGRGVWPLLVAGALLAAVPAWADAPALPPGVPNILDPAVELHFQAVGVGNVAANPDLPVVLFVNTTEEQPQLLLLGFDARNGKNSWSMSTDPLFLIVTFADPASISGVYVDTGFVDRGVPSGSFVAVDEASFPALPDLFKRMAAAGTRTDL